MAGSRGRHRRPVSEVLAELTYWRRLIEPSDPAVVLKSTGEAPARIADLEADLRSRGIAFHWDGERYALDDPEAP